MTEKIVVFYQPSDDDPAKMLVNSGTVIRPREMRSAFSELGYTVFAISGSFKERKKSVEEVRKENICFTYCESANIPLALSGRKHFPIRPFSDLRNIRVLRKKGKVGFFYRDIFWREKRFFKEVGFLKGSILWFFYYFEFFLLINSIDVLFVPSEPMKKHFPKYKKYSTKMSVLPPGCKGFFNDFFLYNYQGIIEVLYSGNAALGTIYDISDLLGILSRVSNCNLHISTEKNISEFKKMVQSLRIENKVCFSTKNYNDSYEKTMCFSVGLIWHVGDICDLEKYMPIKLFYYMEMGLPIIGREGTAYGRFIKDKGIGWTYSSAVEFQELIFYLNTHYSEVVMAAENVRRIRNTETWKQRAKTVSALLL